VEYLVGVATVAGLLVSAIESRGRDSRLAGKPEPASGAAKRQTEDAEVTPLTLTRPAPVNAEEDAAYKPFCRDPNDAAKKMYREAFILKYPESVQVTCVRRVDFRVRAS